LCATAATLEAFGANILFRDGAVDLCLDVAFRRPVRRGDPGVQSRRRPLLRSLPAGKNRLIECIKAHFAEFARPRQTALVKVAAEREACAADIEAQCPIIKPAGGRILLCVKEHFAGLSERCKDAIGHTAERKLGANRE